MQVAGWIAKVARRTGSRANSGFSQDLDGHRWDVAFDPGVNLMPDGAIGFPTRSSRNLPSAPHQFCARETEADTADHTTTVMRAP